MARYRGRRPREFVEPPDHTVTVSCERGERDGAFVIFIDTDELPKDRPLRVCVNDGPVFSARPEVGDHDFYWVGEYVDELNRAR